MDERKEQTNRILEVKDLSIHYITDGEVVQALNGISFTLDYGKTLGLAGETGAGKTTIARAIMRTLPQPPAKVQNGEIYYYDRETGEKTDILNAEETEMREIRGYKMSMVFQDPMTALNPVMRIGRQIAEGIRIHENVSWKEAEKKAMEMLELVGIPAKRYREYPHQFSGGMKQRVVIAIALACNPDLLIADEPTTALDVTIQAQVLEMIKRLQQRKNTAMILITHDFGVIAENCDYVGVVYAGKVVEYGTRDQIFTKPLHPYTKGLFGAIPSIEGQKQARLHSIQGAPPDPTRLPTGCAFCSRCSHAVPACWTEETPVVTLEDGHQCRCVLYAQEAQEAGEKED